MSSSRSSVTSTSASRSRSSSSSSSDKRKVCMFYLKVGACRYGVRCSCEHVEPKRSKTVVLENFYWNYDESINDTTALSKRKDVDISLDSSQLRHFKNFYIETFVEINRRYGRIRHIRVCNNLGDHMRGNVYIKFRNERMAESAVADLNARWFCERPIRAKLSPVANFHGSAVCQEYQNDHCKRGPFCNFLHFYDVPPSLAKKAKIALKSAATSVKFFGSKYDEAFSPTSNSFSSRSSLTSEVNTECASLTPTLTFDDKVFSITTSETSDEEKEDENSSLRKLPKTFRDTVNGRKRYAATSDTDISEQEAEIIQKAQQIMRQQRWRMMKRKLLHPIKLSVH